MVEERGVPEASREMLLSFIRRAKHEEMGMTHVCCNRQSRYLTAYKRFKHTDEVLEPMENIDIDEILEEEAEFIDMLDDEMREVSDKGYGELVEYWFYQIHKALERYADESVPLETMV